MAGGSLAFGVLGTLQVGRDGRCVDLGSPKQRAVLGLLLAAAPAPVATEDLVEEIWGDAGPADPVRSLQVYVSGLRGALGDARLLERTAAGYRLLVDPQQVDAEVFTTSAARAAALLAAGDAEGAERVAREALARWRGEAWHDLRHLLRIGPLALALDEQRLEVELLAAQSALAAGRQAAVVPDLERLVSQHPSHEQALELLVLALHRSGRRARALEVYAAACSRLREESGLDPGPRLQVLHAAVLVDDPGLVVEGVEVRARRHLPAPVTSFVGRSRECAELREEVLSHRLVTLTGPGGVGKTRLALEVGHRLADEFEDGVWFVPLDALTDAATVPQAVADALDLVAPDDIPAALRTWLRDRRALLVLDNFEQVATAAPLLGELLAASPRSHLLVTSRVRLRAYGEHVHELEPLPDSDAVPLFAERAHSARRGFRADDRVARLCAALDGLPLAIELVAARADGISLADMLDQLAAPLELASDGPVDRSERQQSLRAAIAWSVRLLPDEVADAFGRLGVFVGGFTEAAAATVVRPTALPDLVRASLLHVDEGRYRMLETIREYAAEVLGRDRPAVAEAHASWCLDLAEEASAQLTSDRRRWLATLAAEQGNMRAALAHLAAVADEDDPAGERLLRLCVALAPVWFRTAPGSEDVRWLSRAIELAPAGSRVLRARAHYGLAICRGEQGDTRVALGHARDALDLLPEGLDDAWRARAMNTVAGLTRDLGHPAEALPLLEEGLALRRRLADPALGLSIPLDNIGLVAIDVGDTARAREALVEARELAGPDRLDVAIATARLASVEIAEGRTEAAARLLADAVPVLHAEGDRYRLVESLDALAGLAVLRGEAYEAGVLMAAADRALAEDESRMVPADEALRQQRLGDALAALSEDQRRAALDEGRALDLAAALRRAAPLLDAD